MPDTDHDAWVAWRLLGSNHREVARSADVFSDIDRCVAALRALQEVLAVGNGAISVEAIGGLWSWVLTVDRSPVAVASRLYQRQSEGAYNCRVFLAAGPRAELVVNLARH